MESKPLVPKLRFPKFRDAGEWMEKKLGQLSVILRGGSPRPIESYLTRDMNGLNWLKIGDVKKEAKYVTRTEERVRQEALNKTRVVKPGDLILSNSMSFGRPYILEIETCIHDGWIAVTDISTQIDRDYLYYWISAPSSQLFFVINAAGSGVQNLNADIIKSLPICFPNRPEQTKIAECLTSLDELIAAEGRKLDALRTYKKGLMQNLFPREGETVPRLRFPEFRDTGEWNSASIGSLGDIITGSTPATSRNEYYGGKHLFVSPSDISDLRLVEKTKTTLSALGFAECRPIRQGSVLFVCIGSTIGKVAQNAYVCATNQQINSVVASTLHSTDFIYYSLLLESQRIAGLAGRQAIPIINKTLFSSVEVLFPQREEQCRIAGCLTSLDALTTAQAKKLDTLKRHKQGLMQGLFPSMEVTA